MQSSTQSFGNYKWQNVNVNDVFLRQNLLMKIATIAINVLYDFNESFSKAP